VQDFVDQAVATPYDQNHVLRFEILTRELGIDESADAAVGLVLWHPTKTGNDWHGRQKIGTVARPRTKLDPGLGRLTG
jgi:hypothetical protein